MLVKIENQYINPDQIVRVFKTHANQVVILLRDREQVVIVDRELDDIAQKLGVKRNKTLGDLCREDED